MMAPARAWCVARWRGVLEELDLCGEDGRISFAKWMAVVTLAAATLGELTTAEAVLFCAVPYGWKAVRLILSRWNVSASVTDARQRIRSVVSETKRVIQERRAASPDDSFEENRL